ncbi:MAG TPA: transglycosylase SLT domain-containing protein [Vicinamibacterales bacterium]|nr:transglycosylase SLT domain-containing protein [Vicinamibacterales bacterium]
MTIRTFRALVALSLPSVLGPSGALPEASAQLSRTTHAALPEHASELWLVPSGNDRTARVSAQYDALSDAAARYRAGDYAGALQLASAPSLKGTPLAGYARYYQGLSQLRLLRTDDARKTFDALLDDKPAGALATAAALADGEAAEAAGDNAAAVRRYEKLATDKRVVSDEVLARLGRTALASGDRKTAADAYVRLYYEFPLTPAGVAAGPALESLRDLLTRSGYAADIGRAQMFFGAGRYEESRAAFGAIRAALRDDEQELADLRIAESNFQLKNYAAARDALRPYLDSASRRAEARFFYLSAIRGLGDHEQYLTLARKLIAEFPDSSWAEETLNHLARHYILGNQDQAAASTFRELYSKFPRGQHAERAAWKDGWWSYKNRNYADTIRVFESAAAGFPRSNYRPSYLYWAARSHARIGAASEGHSRMRLVYDDYARSYYGRLAEGHLRRAGLLPANDTVRRASSAPPAPAAPSLPTEETIRLLLASGLYDDALSELRYAQRVWGASPAIDATIAWAYHQKGELRRAITLMRRAYPQYLTADGLPSEILQVIYPLVYWDSIRRESSRLGLDPYVVAALIGQESTFDPQIKSPANAWGLMQIVPATGRRLARNLEIKNFTTERLTDPELNLRLGTYYFARLIQQFGGTYYALASYNAGENRVVRWKAERPGLDEDEFIDDIPFPETQNYVKRILGTAEDYRLLYGGGNGRPQIARAPSKPPAAAAGPAPTVRKPATKKSAVKKASAKKVTTKKVTAKKRPAKKPATKKTTIRKRTTQGRPR